jgi:hypothetical protein
MLEVGSPQDPEPVQVGALWAAKALVYTRVYYLGNSRSGTVIK